VKTEKAKTEKAKTEKAKTEKAKTEKAKCEVTIKNLPKPSNDFKSSVVSSEKACNA